MPSKNQDSRGRFVKGNKASKGRNQHTWSQHHFKKTLHEVITEADHQAIIRRLIKACKAGDIAAIKLYMDHTIGKPAETVQITAGVKTNSIAELRKEIGLN